MKIGGIIGTYDRRGIQMIESISFTNFKVLERAELPLGAFTLIVGPNGSGKSTAMQGLQFVLNPGHFEFGRVVTVGKQTASAGVRVVIRWVESGDTFETESKQLPGQNVGPTTRRLGSGPLEDKHIDEIRRRLASFRIFSFDPDVLSAPVPLTPNLQLERKGSHLAGVLDRLRDSDPERFESLNDELGSVATRV